ncbi:hypothetical protein A8C75_20705 [Marinobacterium aestuarii]|uniref:HTH lysR-type domain-containing protein n=1 Tax=Marinobacterium aestuarii TaxID=1821621 RepID=A0A1A9F380_9GAMM|nr:LysR substrate-binding domain-containing protein [Marinobacterium aestuarii]ANG64657.1 hypothetical protein A8C75_20705 [Marinobacterium aestuarii]
MELKWLKDFVALAENGSFSKAAEARFVTQPAFSRRIRSLENWLGVPLVDRNQYPTTLTRVGAEFVVEAKRMIADTYSTRDRLRLHDEQRQSLQFFAQHSLAVSFFPPWVQSVESLFGDTLVRLQTGNLHDVLDAFLAGMGDFLLCFSSPVTISQLQREDIEALQVGSDRLIPVSAVDAAGEPCHAPVAGHRLKLLTYPQDSFLGELVKSECLPRMQPELNYQPMFENALAEGLKALTLQGQGAAWLPESLVRQELDAGQLVELGSPMVAVDLKILLYRFRQARTPAVDAFWRALPVRDI